LIGVWAAVVLAALVCAGGAAGAGESSPGRVVALELQGTHGYSLLALVGVSPGKRQGRAVVFVDRPGAAVVYGAPATLTETSVQADLGPVGHISLELQLSGVKRTVHSRCDKEPVSYESATWVGEFEFRGEEGYTTASATSLPFEVRPLLDLICAGVTSELHVGGDDLPGAGLSIGSRGKQPRVKVSARTNAPGKPVEVSARIREQRGKIEIERGFQDRFPSSVFDYDPHLTEATLQPPAPFSGRGVFRRAAAPANRWTGNLRVDFPGRSGVPVTGDRFRPVLRHGEWRTNDHARPLAAESRRAPASPLALPAWPSTKPSPTAFATFSPPGPS
jgi:hypothetical protein